mgnify:FL=1
MVWLINITVERNLIGANNMKKILLLLITLLIYSNAYADWTKVLPGNNASLFIDFDTLIEKDGFIYWWYLDSWGKGSEKTYAQGDCNLKGFRVVKRIRYSFPMGEGEGVERNINGAWEYYQPNTGFEILLNFICDMSRLSPEEKGVRIESLTKRNEALERESKLNLTQSNIEELSPELKTIKSSYFEAIQEKIKTNWKYEEAKDNWFCDVLINQANNGAVEAVKILNCRVSNKEDSSIPKSKSQPFGNSIRRAVFRSSPLPLPSNESLFDKEFIIRFPQN